MKSGKSVITLYLHLQLGIALRTDSVLTTENQGSVVQTSGMLMSMLNFAMREDMGVVSMCTDLMNHQGVQWHFVWKIIPVG